MKNLIALFAVLLLSVTTLAQTKAKAQVCYGDQGIDAEAPYVLTINRVELTQIDIITEDFLSSSVVGVVNVLSFEPSSIYILSVHPQTPVSDDVVASNKKVDRTVRRSVATLLKKYKITTSGYSLECNGVVTGLPRAGGMN